MADLRVKGEEMLLTCDNESAALRWWNTEEPLTHPSDYGREGLEVNSTQEQWKTVLGSEGKHEVSSFGRVRSVGRPHVRGGLLTGGVAEPNGHLVVKVWRHGKSASVRVRDLVAEAFLPASPSAKAQVVHQDGDRMNNHAANLAWAIPQRPRCTVNGCDKFVCGNGLCRGHYARVRERGDVRAHVPLRSKGRSLDERFWEKVDANGPCWEWTGAVSAGTGYGSFWVGGKSYRGAHRVSYETLVGPVPEGLVLDHLCRNRVCVNPDHLEPVTQKENAIRGAHPWALKERHQR